MQSRDVRRHLDWILERLLPAKDKLQALKAEGVEAAVSCYWLSVYGHGGPTLSPQQMRGLVEFGLECWFDCYSSGEGEDAS